MQRYINPKKWSIATRFVFTTGFLLISGALITLFTISYHLHRTTNESVHRRLGDYKLFYEREINHSFARQQSTLSMLSVNEEIASALEDNNRLGLQLSVAKINNQKLITAGYKPSELQFFSPELEPVFNSTALNKLGNPLRKNFTMVETSKQLNGPQAGVHLVGGEPLLSASTPAIKDDQVVGFIESSIRFDNLYSHMDLADVFGLAVIYKKVGAKSNKENKKTVITFGITATKTFLTQTGRVANGIGIDGDIYFLPIELKSFSGKRIGEVVLYYQATQELKELYLSIKIMAWMTGIGVLVLFLSLFFNINRIIVFLKQLSRAITNAPSNEYHQPFLEFHTSCCSVLPCKDRGCPVEGDPDKVCYIEVGFKAIEPEKRNSCHFLEDYKECKRCPAYESRDGDELSQVRLSINGLMEVWEKFLQQAGDLFSDVFKQDGKSAPTLSSVGLYLSQMAGLSSFNHDMQGVYSKEEVYSQLQWVFTSQFGLSNFNLLEVNSSENRLSAVIDLADLTISHMDVMINCELCRTKRVAEVVNSEKNPYLCPYFDIDHEKEVRCCLPMVMGGRVGAVFTFVVQRDKWKEVKKDLPIMMKYLEETAPTLASLRLLQISREQALRDPLTKCHNRRFMDEYLVQLEGLNSRNPRNVGFVMADLDHFKMVNDEFGHQAGDDVLKQLAEILKKNIRKTDLLIRYGGEEFLIILMELKEEGIAEQIAEKIRHSVEQSKLALPTGGTIQKTISMGVAEFPKDAEYLYKAIKYADVALYQAKEQGRNKVLRFQTSMWKEEDY